MKEKLAAFKWSIGATVVAIVAAYFYRNVHGATIVALLIALELSISFDNAVVNATVLRNLSERWQRVFLTWGILIAVVGMRIIFPILIVAIATRLGTLEVVDQALNNRQAYGENVERARPIIGAFGGMFLLLVATDFLFDREREIHWLPKLDRWLARAGVLAHMPVAVALAALVLTSQLVPNAVERDVLLAGAVGILVFLVVHGVADAVEQRYSDRIEQGGKEGGLTGKAAFAAFLYLEMLDASFSLDGVVGAFAITVDIVLIALGLGVGALYVRSLTVYLVRRRTLMRYRYLSNGAHWAILFLGIVLLVSIEYHPPEWITGTIGLGLIGAAFVTSVVYNRRHGEPEEADDEGDEGQEESDEAERDEAPQESQSAG